MADQSRPATDRPGSELSGGDFDDPANFEQRNSEAGHIIAEGTTAVAGYGSTSVDRLLFIVNVVRCHVLRQSCAVHIDDRAALESLLGRPTAWCPSCGTKLRRRPR